MLLGAWCLRLLSCAVKVRDEALERTNRRFIERFKNIEQNIALDGKDLGQMPLEEMELYWQKAKKEVG